MTNNTDGYEHLAGVQLPNMQGVLLDQGGTLFLNPFDAVMKEQRVLFEQVLADHGVDVSYDAFVDSWNGYGNKRFEERGKREGNAHRSPQDEFNAHYTQQEGMVEDGMEKMLIDMGRKPACGHCSDADVGVYGIIGTLAPALLGIYRAGLRIVINNDPRTEEVRHTLQTLRDRGKSLGVFSNDRVVGLGLTLDALGITDLFEYIGTSELLGVSKPSPTVYGNALDALGTEKDETVYVGDNEMDDVGSSKEYGLYSILYKPAPLQTADRLANEGWRDETHFKCEHAPDSVARAFSDLIEILP